jgi:hypothetical protein
MDQALRRRTEQSSSSRSGSPSVRCRPAGPQGPAERESRGPSGSPSVRRRPAGPQRLAERSSSSRFGSPSLRRYLAGPQRPAGRSSSSRSGSPSLRRHNVPSFAASPLKTMLRSLCGRNKIMKVASNKYAISSSPGQVWMRAFVVLLK